MKKLLTCIIFLLLIGACKEKYIAPIQSPATGYLVVEGFINSGASATSITLTRTTKLYDTAAIINEHNAVVNILGENNEVFLLPETANGVYSSVFPLALLNGEKYRLQIKTQDNKEYLSDFATVKHTPPIDSISWQRENGGVKIYVNTHDPQNNTKYYKWNYDETWEIRSFYLSTLKYLVDPFTNKIDGVGYFDPVGHNADTSIYRCWRSSSSNTINIGSSEKLSTDLIYLPLLSIEQASEKISVLYSINVKQYALSHDAYLFFQKIKKNTEQLGSLFDPQPSELQGNIHCTTSPGETVVGYVDVSEEQESRVFIRNTDLPDWNYRRDCQLVTLANQADSINKTGVNLLPVAPVATANLSIVSFSAADPSCVDCTSRGTNIKPFFWP